MQLLIHQSMYFSVKVFKQHHQKQLRVKIKIWNLTIQQIVNVMCHISAIMIAIAKMIPRAHTQLQMHTLPQKQL